MFEDNQNIAKENRFGKIALVIVGILALGLGVYRVSYGVKAPFIKRPSAGNFEFKSEEQQIEEKKYKDTDNDGLSDYEEEYVYETSPYLKDSDSDGIDDKTEIDKGTDPNCPEGQKCAALPDLLPGGAASGTPAAADLLGGDLNLSGLANGGVSGPMSPDQIRELLKKAGAPESTLKDVSDDDLLKLYQETLQQVTEEQTTN